MFPFNPFTLLKENKALKEKVQRLNATEEKLAELESSLEKQILEKSALSFQNSKLTALSDMAGGIAHEINNPLTIIHGSADLLSTMLRHGEFSTEKAYLAISRIQRTVERIAKIVKDLKTFSNPNEAEISFIDTQDFIDDFMDVCCERFSAADISFRMVFNIDDEMIYGNPVELNHVMINLLNNSYDAIVDQEEKWIKIKLNEDKKNYIIEVTDSGPGIPKELHSKILEPFFTTKLLSKRAGLGLSISRSLIMKNNGTLEIDPSNANTSFIIKLPKPDQHLIDAELQKTYELYQVN